MPTFLAGPLDALKAVDPYQVNQSVTESDITSILDKLDSNILGQVRPQLNDKTINAALRTATEISGKSKGISANDILRYGRELAPGLTNVLDSVGSATKGKILEVVKEYEISPAITNTIGNVLNSVSLDRLVQVNGVQNFVKTMTSTVTGGRALDLSNSRFVSLILGGVIHQGNKAGVSGVVGDVLGAIDNQNTTNLISGLIVSSVSQTGNLNDLYAISQKSSYGYINTIYPTTIRNFVKSYQANAYVSNQIRNLDNELLKIEETFNRIDPHWFEVHIGNGIYLPALHLLLEPSNDFLDVAKYASMKYPEHPIRKLLIHITQFKSTTTERELGKEFPYLVLHKK